MNLQIWLGSGDRKIKAEIERLAKNGKTRSEIAKELIERGLDTLIDGDVERKIDTILEILQRQENAR